MSFLSRLFKKKKDDAPQPPRAASTPHREQPRPAARPAPQPAAPQPAAPQPAAPKSDARATGSVGAPAPVGAAVHASTAPLGSKPESAAAAKPAAPQPAAPQPEAPLTPLIGAEQDEHVAPLPEVEAARAIPAEPAAHGAAAAEARTTPLESPRAPEAQGAFAATVPLGGAGLADAFFDELLDDFDANFDAALGQGGPAAAAAAGPAGEHGLVVDHTPVRELFADIAANYVRAVRNFMLEIHRGDTAKEWIDICQPAVHSIKRAAEKMELGDVHRAVEDFDTALELAANSPGRTISGEAREELIATYDVLVHLMPQAFTLDAERDQRESIIIHSLLLQIHDVRKVTIDKLYAAGLTTLEVFFLAKAEDLAATAGIPDWLAGKIVEKFQTYRSEAQAVALDASRSAERAKLAALVANLRSEQEAYERASNGWTEDAAEEKKRLRAARQETLLQIQVVLAQLGEVDFIHEIEKLPFERRIDRLGEYLEQGPAGEIPL